MVYILCNRNPLYLRNGEREREEKMKERTNGTTDGEKKKKKKKNMEYGIHLPKERKKVDYTFPLFLILPKYAFLFLRAKPFSVQ